MKLLEVLLPSVLGPGEIPITTVDVEFEPLWNMSETEESTIRTNDTNNLVGLANIGAISSTEAEEEARARGILIVDAQPEDDLGAAPPAPDLKGALDRLAGQSVIPESAV